MTLLTRAIGVAVVALSLAGCGKSIPLQTTEAVAVVQPGELPAPQGGLALLTSDGYRIGPFDRIIIDIFGFPDLMRREVQVDASGHFSVPMAGEIEALGLTPAEAAALISGRLRAGHVRAPQVSVNLDETTSRFVTVDGQVTQPGNYPAVTDMTLMRAIAAAKGANEYAKLDDVVIFRTVGEQRMAALYSLKAIRRGVYADPKVYPFDTIVVGDSPGRRIFRDFLAAAPLLVSPLVAILDSNR